jgi:asparagine synthase (glutamine-hydrolysing)
VSRWLAGCFDLRRGERGGALSAALAPEPCHLLWSGSLQLAYTGPPARAGDLTCLFDGHLDNAGELGAELGVGSEVGDSEEALLACAYRRWGARLPARLRGDFVLLVWDAEQGRGLLARDQLGARPLFLHEGADGALRFAGEVRPLLALLPSRPAPDAASVAHWIAASTRPGPQTLYEGVRRLGPATVLHLGPDGVREEQYWRPRFDGALELPPGELAELVRERLRVAVRRRHVEGETAVLMSGGLDSSAIAALCAAESEQGTLACTATFPDHPATDESGLIEELRRTLALGGPNAVVRPGGLLASMLGHLARWQLPPLGWGDFWTSELMRAGAEQGVRIVLGGDGGDELFGPRSYLLADRLRAGHPRQALKLARSLPGAGPWVQRRDVARVYGALAVGGAVPASLHRLAGGLLTRREAPAWMRADAARALADSDDRSAWKRLDGPLWWSHAAHGVSQGIERAGVYEHLRRRAAALGLEARHPMLDLDLVEVGLAQPPEATLDPRFNRPLLRTAMRGLLPDSVRLRPGKAWFDSLIVDSLTGPDLGLVRELLTGPGAELAAYVDLTSMRGALFDDPRARRSDPFRWMWQVWRLLSAECWLRSQSAPVGEILPSGASLSATRIEIERTPDSSLFPP